MGEESETFFCEFRQKKMLANVIVQKLQKK